MKNKIILSLFLALTVQTTSAFYVTSMVQAVALIVWLKDSGVRVKKWLLPTAQENKEREIKALQRENKLIRLKARDEFNRCVDDNCHDPVRDSIGIPHRCYSARDKFLLLKQNKTKS